jgi:ACR3 family arsenite transporter
MASPDCKEQDFSSCYKTQECNYDYCVEKVVVTEELKALKEETGKFSYYRLYKKNTHTITALLRRMGFLDRFLAVWILLAMIIGVVIGYFSPNVQASFETVQFGSVSVPIAIGLLVMMYPVLCKIQYERLHIILSDRKIWMQIFISLIINWVIGPIIMTALAWACLPDLPGFRTGVIMVGLAR